MRISPIDSRHIKKNLFFAGKIAKHILHRRNIAYLILFLTDKCNARCRMCFSQVGLADKIKSDRYPILSLEDIERLLSRKSLADLVQFTLSGGEPFLRDDIEGIVNIYARLHPYSRITIPTNGLLTEKIVDIMGRIVPANRELEISVPLTILGIGADHDDMTGVAGHFQKVNATIQSLQPLRRYPNFKLAGVTVLSGYNQNLLQEIVEFFNVSADKFDHFNILFARGNPREPLAKQTDHKIYVRGRRTLLNKGVHFNLLLNALWWAIDHEIKSGTMGIDCNAGKKLLVVSERGDVSPCELLYNFTDPYFGNLQECDFDLERLLQSRKARRIIRFIENKQCHCSFECAIFSSIILSPANYKVFAQALLHRS